MITGYVKCGMIREARKLFDRSDAKRDVVTWTAMVRGYFRLNQLQLLQPSRKIGVSQGVKSGFVGETDSLYFLSRARNNSKDIKESDTTERNRNKKTHKKTNRFTQSSMNPKKRGGVDNIQHTKSQRNQILMEIIQTFQNMARQRQSISSTGDSKTTEPYKICTRNPKLGDKQNVKMGEDGGWGAAGRESESLPPLGLLPGEQREMKLLQRENPL
ncbi:hypothetical protein Fmac_018121 [Flemingia macrophylla]|uniref:Pentatricopeptide repeat-containing protein n=1 Tax=Flemingia macrophylla TaxID=520843 RepID=A0ABD1M420_9FABA